MQMMRRDIVNDTISAYATCPPPLGAGDRRRRWWGEAECINKDVCYKKINRYQFAD